MFPTSGGIYSGGADGSGYQPDLFAPAAPFDVNQPDDGPSLTADNAVAGLGRAVVSRRRNGGRRWFAAALLLLPVLAADSTPAAIAKRPSVTVVSRDRAARPAGAVVRAVPRRFSTPAIGRPRQPSVWQVAQRPDVRRVAAVQVVLPVLRETTSVADRPRGRTLVSMRHARPGSPGRHLVQSPAPMIPGRAAPSIVVAARRANPPRQARVQLQIPRRGIAPDGRPRRPSVMLALHRPTVHRQAVAITVLPVLRETVSGVAGKAGRVLVVPPRARRIGEGRGAVTQILGRTSVAMGQVPMVILTARAPAMPRSGAVLRAIPRAWGSPDGRPRKPGILTPSARPLTRRFAAAITVLPVLRETVTVTGKAGRVLVVQARAPRPGEGRGAVTQIRAKTTFTPDGRPLTPGVLRPHVRPKRSAAPVAVTVLPVLRETVTATGKAGRVQTVPRREPPLGHGTGSVVAIRARTTAASPTGRPRLPATLVVARRDDTRQSAPRAATVRPLAPGEMARVGTASVVPRPPRPRETRGAIIRAVPRRFPSVAPLRLPILAHLVGRRLAEDPRFGGAVLRARPRANLFTPTAFPQLVITLEPTGRFVMVDRAVSGYSLTEWAGGRWSMADASTGRYTLLDLHSGTFRMTTTETLSSRYLVITEDQEFDVEVSRRNATTGEWEPATGLTGISFSIADSEGGAAIGSLTFAASERGTIGRYYAIADTGALTSALSTSSYPDGTTVYLVLTKTGDVVSRSWPKIIRRQKVGDG